MSVLRLLLREIAHRKVNFILGLLSITAAVAVFVAMLTLNQALDRETTRVMRDMGFNVRILPKDADLSDFWSRDFAQAQMPEEYVHTLAESKVMTIRHLVARLTKKIQWRGRSVLLVGALPEIPVKHRTPKPAMIAAIPEGTVWVGHELSRGLGIKPGDSIEVEGKTLKVTECPEARGSKSDITLFANLHDVQAITGQEGMINEILALKCKCKGSILETLQAEIGAILPQTQLILDQNLAVTREKTRQMVEDYANLVIPMVLVISALWIGLLAFGNVRQRRVEIGILRAVGWGSVRIAALFIGKAVGLGVVGAALGYAVGTGVALHWGPDIFEMTAQKIQPAHDLFVASLVGAPLLCALASYLPAMLAVIQDPAVVLTKE